MSTRTTLSVQKREGLGKGANRRLREKNLVPGVFYSTLGDNVAIQAEALPIAKAYAANGTTTVIDLEIEEGGKKTTYPALFWQNQRHPTKSHFTHVDFFGVDLDKKVKIQVPVCFTGIAAGTKLGGKLETYRERVTLLAKPLDMPSRIELDITELGTGSTVFVADLPLPEGVQAIYDVNFAMLHVTQPGGAAATGEEEEA